ncbi:MAG: DnaB-like helicase C-terminal domain-containing protein [Bacteroidia bacterium]
MAQFKSNTFIQESKDLSKYGKEFQAKLLSLLIKDRPFSFSILPIIKDIYFSDIYFKTIFSCISDFVTEFYTTPSIDNLRIELQKRGESLTIYEKILKQVDEISLEDREFIIKSTRAFCFTKHSLAENEKITASLREGNFELAKKLSIESFKYSGLESAKILDLKKDIEQVNKVQAQRLPMPVMFPTFNDNSRGGISNGEICIVVASSNFGKSQWLVAQARHLNYQGKNVAFFSYEMEAEPLVEKYMAGVLDVVQDDVLKYHKKDTIEALNKEGLGELKIVTDKASNATLANIQSQIEYFKSIGFFPHAIIIDGLNQLKLAPGVRTKDDNEKYELLTEGLKDMCKDIALPAWACWQTNRSGFSNDLNGVESIGKAIEVFQKADQVITFSQPGEMKERNECIAYLLKNRLGLKEISLLCHYDPAKVLFLEKSVINTRVLLSDMAKKKVATTATNIREKLQTGAFLPKK